MARLGKKNKEVAAAALDEVQVAEVKITEPVIEEVKVEEKVIVTEAKPAKVESLAKFLF